MPPRLLPTLLLCLGTGMVSAAVAQGLSDPTRPPAVIAAQVPDGAAQSGLQTVIRRAGAKPAAIISGQYVELGGMVGESRLVRIGEDRIELRGPAGTEIMFLTPAVEKKMPVSAEQPRGRKGARVPTKDGAGK